MNRDMCWCSFGAGKPKVRKATHLACSRWYLKSTKLKKTKPVLSSNNEWTAWMLVIGRQWASIIPSIQLYQGMLDALGDKWPQKSWEWSKTLIVGCLSCCFSKPLKINLLALSLPMNAKMFSKECLKYPKMAYGLKTLALLLLLGPKWSATK